MGKCLRYGLAITFCFVMFGCKPSAPNTSNVVDILNKDDGKSEVLSDEEMTEETLLEIVDTIIPVIYKTDFDPQEWAELIADNSMTVLDLRYATENNFTQQQIYDCARCFLRPVAYEKLIAFREHMNNNHQLGIILYDCYRPRPYQQKLWDILPDPKFVGNPAKGSMHNRGMAVDIGLIDHEGNILDMGTDFDHFGRASFHSAKNISKEAIKNRKLLKTEIGLFGFKPITSEWWHYSYREDIGALSEWLWDCD